MSRFDLFPAIGISASALTAERKRMEVSANNLANANTTKGADGEVYKRQQVMFSTVLDDTVNTPNGVAGVEVDGVVDDNRDPIEVYAPYHPDADESGMVQKPNISVIEEMMDMMTATRAYEANLSAMKQSKDIANKTITLGKQ